VQAGCIGIHHVPRYVLKPWFRHSHLLIRVLDVRERPPAPEFDVVCTSRMQSLPRVFRLRKKLQSWFSSCRISRRTPIRLRESREWCRHGDGGRLNKVLMRSAFTFSRFKIAIEQTEV
jgi:hypothetical protein